MLASSRASWLLVLLVALCLPVRAERDPSWPVPDWQASTPEAEGMDPAALARLVEYGTHVGMDGLVVVRNGRLVMEAYYAPFRADMKHRINSATKAVVGVLAGIAIGRGELPAPHTPVADLLGAGAELQERWRGMKLQHLLDMTSGIDWVEPLSGGLPVTLMALEGSADWETFILQRPLARTPGTAFNYNSGNPHLVSLAIARSAGLSTQDYARRHLFGPLGVGDVRWRADPQGVATGGFGLYLRTRDMARIGLLYLRGGQWNGTQLVPRAWVQRVFTAQQPMDTPGFRYADYWWTLPSQGAYMAVGYWRQVILVLPQLGIVAATHARSNYPLEDLIRHLRAAVQSDAPLPADPAGTALLRRRIGEAAAAPAAAAPPPGDAAAAAAARYRFGDNLLGIEELALDLQARPPVYRMKVRSARAPGGSRTLVREVGLEGRYAPGDDDGAPFFARASWQAGGALLIEQRWPEETTATSFLLEFDGDAVEVTHTSTRGVKTRFSGRKAP